MQIESVSVQKIASRPPKLENVDISEHSVVGLLFAVAKATRALLGLRLAKIGFHNGQDEFLMAIENHNPVSISALSERLGVRPSTVSKMTDRLVERDLVRRVADKQDSRRTMLRVTPSGIAAKAIIRDIHDYVENEMLNDMHRDDAETMQAGLLLAQTRLNARLMRLR